MKLKYPLQALFTKSERNAELRSYSIVAGYTKSCENVCPWLISNRKLKAEGNPCLIFVNIAPLCSSAASLPDLESTLVNEFLIQKLERFACAFIEISLFYTTNRCAKWKNDKWTKSSPSICILRGEFTGHCCLVALLLQAQFSFKIKTSLTLQH